jgi:hypothetical protein
LVVVLKYIYKMKRRRKRPGLAANDESAEAESARHERIIKRLTTSKGEIHEKRSKKKTAGDTAV